ncbi:ketopantoate reductase family protein [Microvirga antarctica]|uniref:ketopantoate reductase family protein n=1 Tax=Microvirga antarctica TaxID=2819233 RepID=UPI001B30C50A|nr:2-dehydropantoate 2-reductase [Microvirga antarctica]
MDARSFAIVGAGAIGGIVGAHLIKAGHAVIFIESNADHRAAIRADGLKISGHRDIVVHPEVFAPGEFNGLVSHLLLAVKSRDTNAALSPLSHLLADDGYVVSLQNGLEEYKIAEIVGNPRTIGAYLTFGGFYKEPGHIVYGGPGSFKVGELDGSITPRLEDLQQALSHQQPVQTTSNIFGYLWAKMALGAVYFGTATVDAPVLDIYADARCRTVLGRFAGEAVAVADALKVGIENCDGFDPKAFRMTGAVDDEAVEASWKAQDTYWRSHDNTHTGVWRDLAIHKRPTEVDWQVGEIIRLADQIGQDVPNLKTLRQIIKEIEEGARSQSWANLQSLA